MSEPLRPLSTERKASIVPFLNRGRTTSSACRSSRICLESDETVDSATTTSTTVDESASTTIEAKEIRITESGTKILADAPEFIKPDRDMHDYRMVQLPNNLKVLLISTAAASSGAEEKSARVEAASVHVQAGHFDDTIPGLAHFNEQ